MIKDILKADLKRRFDKPSLKSLSTIAIDEFYAGRKTKHYTFVLDLKSGAVVYVGKGKGADALKGFWKRLRPYKDDIKAVAMDLSPAFIKAVRENLPGADLVFDPFHIMKPMNEKLDELRRELCSRAVEENRVFIKNSRWVLLKGNENLSERPDPRHGNKNERQRLEEALAFNQPLMAAYYLKEELRLLWNQGDKKTGRAYPESRMAKADASGITLMGKMAESLRRHQDGILAYFDHRITSGPMEATNTKIRVMQRQTYGLRDQEFFELKVKSLHECSARLVRTR
jgi:transposase